jgi:hypothetical protein
MCEHRDNAQTIVTFRTYHSHKAPPLVCPHPRAITVGQKINWGSLMFVAHIKRPRCQQCEGAMSLRLIEPEKPGFDAQTFECPKCFVSETVVISICGEADDSIALPRASQTTPLPGIATMASRFTPDLNNANKQTMSPRRFSQLNAAKVRSRAISELATSSPKGEHNELRSIQGWRPD